MISINQIAPALCFLLLATISIATTTQLASTSLTISMFTHASSTAGSRVTSSSTVLHPSLGEIVVYGSPYTIQWRPPAVPGSISIELWDNDEWSWASAFEAGSNITDQAAPVTCDGWFVNSQCSKIASSVPNSGSHGLSCPFSIL
jgi:hypothetical protein